MTKTTKILIAAGAGVLLAGVLARVLWVKKTTCQMLNTVADEGYETAADILFPDKKMRSKRKQHYGPVWRR